MCFTNWLLNQPCFTLDGRERYGFPDEQFWHHGTECNGWFGDRYGVDRSRCQQAQLAAVEQIRQQDWAQPPKLMAPWLVIPQLTLQGPESPRALVWLVGKGLGTDDKRVKGLILATGCKVELQVVHWHTRRIGVKGLALNCAIGESGWWACGYEAYSETEAWTHLERTDATPSAPDCFPEEDSSERCGGGLQGYPETVCQETRGDSEVWSSHALMWWHMGAEQEAEKGGLIPDSNCVRCGEHEDEEHILHYCTHWKRQRDTYRDDIPIPMLLAGPTCRPLCLTPGVEKTSSIRAEGLALELGCVCVCM